MSLKSTAPNGAGVPTSVEALAMDYLASIERAAARRVADQSPTGRATREATAGALGAAMASHIRTQPSKALAAHGAGVYSMQGSRRDVVAVRIVGRPVVAAAPVVPRPPAFGSLPDKMVLDPRSNPMHPGLRLTAEPEPGTPIAIESDGDITGAWKVKGGGR